MSRYPTLPSTDTHDPYELADPGYSINNFYTQATADSSGFRCRVANEHLSIISALVASKDIPELKTPADFVRDAIRHRLYWVSKNYKVNGLKERLLLDFARNQAEERTAVFRRRREALDAMRDSFDAALREKSMTGCQAAIEDAEALVVEELNDPFQVDLKTLLDRMKTEMEGM